MTEPSQPAPPDGLESADYTESPSPEAPVFQVTYTGAPARNTMRLDGEGELTFDGGDVIVEADQQPASGLPRRVRFMFTLREVARIGLHDGAVVLAIEPEAQRARTYYLSFYVSSEEDAQRVMALLHAPEAPAPGVEDAQVHAFQARLRRAQAPATRGLLIANIALFVAMALSGVSMTTPNSVDLIRWGARLNPLIAEGQWWRLLTPMFVHIGLPHLLFNMWALRNLGDFVERLYGTRRFLALYLVTGLIGNIASFFFFPTVLAAGASGAIFGVLGGLVGFIVRRRHAIPRPMLAHLRSSALSFIALNLAFGFMVSGIDNSAHLGGLISGMLLGWVLAPAPREDEGPGLLSPRRDRTIGLALAVVLTGLMLLGAAATDSDRARKEYFLATAPEIVTEIIKEKLGEKARKCESVTLLKMLGPDDYLARARLSGGILADMKIKNFDTNPEIELATKDGMAVFYVPEGK